MHSLCHLMSTTSSSSNRGTSKLLSFGSSLMTRLTFYAESAYLIDHAAYCLNDIENGILRGNKVSPVPLTRKHIDDSSGSADPRLEFVIKSPDPRIHFALNCGAVSCPPILVYNMIDTEVFNRQLQMATSLYLSNHVAVVEAESSSSTSGKSNTVVVRISPLFQWYRIDFLEDMNKRKGNPGINMNNKTNALPSDDKVCDAWIIEWISMHLDNKANEKQQALQNQLNQVLSDSSTGKVILKIEYEDYNWSINELH